MRAQDGGKFSSSQFAGIRALEPFEVNTDSDLSFQLSRGGFDIINIIPPGGVRMSFAHGEVGAQAEVLRLSHALTPHVDQIHARTKRLNEAERRWEASERRTRRSMYDDW